MRANASLTSTMISLRLLAEYEESRNVIDDDDDTA